MEPSVFAAIAKDKPKDKGFRMRELIRLLRYVKPFRKLLGVGLLCTILYAALHTFSIGAAFPVFKILLEKEGLQGWVNRSVAGDQLGCEFGQITKKEATRVLLASVKESSALYKAGVEIGQFAGFADGRPATELLQSIAHAKPGDVLSIRFWPSLRADDTPLSDQSITIAAANLQSQALLWIGSMLPEDTDANKIAVLKNILIALVFIVVSANVFRYFGEVLIAKAILRSMMALRADLYERTLHLPMSFFASMHSSDLVTRFVQDILEVQRGMVTLFGKFIREPLRASFIFSLALVLDWRVTLAMALVVPSAVVIFFMVGKSVKKANQKLLKAYGVMIGALTQSLQNLRVVKAYTAEKHERQRLAMVDRRMLRQQLKLAKLQAFLSPMMETLAVLVGSVLTIWLASLVVNQELEMGKFATLGFTLSMLFDPLRKLSDVYVRVKRSTAGAERIFEVMDEPVEQLQENTNQQKAQPLADQIEYENVTLTYPNADVPALNNISCSIKRGETLALVGPNGCGKTTLVSMMLRFFDPDEGCIKYDSTDIKELSLVSLRNQFSLVSQDSVIFEGTPIENIAFGDTSADKQRVIEAARQAHADEFISALPGGYEANLAERGSSLSGGQRQRLAIARAIYRDAPVLIFDEATSQIDAESELSIQQALQEISKERTTIIIAHRLSTIQFANRIIVMDRGQIIDTGVHTELIERCPLYRRLCETQFATI